MPYAVSWQIKENVGRSGKLEATDLAKIKAIIGCGEDPPGLRVIAAPANPPDKLVLKPPDAGSVGLAIGMRLD